MRTIKLKCWICATVALLSLTSIWATPDVNTGKIQPQITDRPMVSGKLKAENKWIDRVTGQTSSNNYRDRVLTCGP